MTVSRRVAARYLLAQSLREKLADLEHSRWSHWMDYQFSKGAFNEDGSWTMPPDLVKRWKGQAETPYNKLSDAEKDSDRKEADKTLVVVEGSDRKVLARKMRHKQRGKAKLRTKKYYRKRRQRIKQKSKQWRKANKNKVKLYRKRRNAQPSMYRLMPAKKAGLDHALFQPEEDISLLKEEIEFWDPSTDTPDVGFVDWIDLDRGEVHTIFIRETGERFQKTYELYDWMDTAALMFEDDEEILLQALDELHEGAEEGEDEED